MKDIVKEENLESEKTNEEEWELRARRQGSFRKKRHKSDGGHKSKHELHLKWRHDYSVSGRN